MGLSNELEKEKVVKEVPREVYYGEIPVSSCIPDGAQNGEMCVATALLCFSSSSSRQQHGRRSFVAKA